MTYPASSDVSAGQPTASAHYNNLRKDALYLGNTITESVNLGSFLDDYVENLSLEYLATNRVKVPYDANRPARMMINGRMLKATADVTLPSGELTGFPAGTYYVFAFRLAAPEFGLAIASTPALMADTKLIGQFYYDGASIITGTIICYYNADLPPADYDSGWWACAYGTAYTKNHYLGVDPRLVVLFYCASADGSTNQYPVFALKDTAGYMSPLMLVTNTSIRVKTGSDAAAGVYTGTFAVSAAGYYRVQAWR